MKNLKHNFIIFILGILLIISLLYKGCGKPEITTTKPSDNEWKLVASHSDTVKPPDTVYAFKTKYYTKTVEKPILIAYKDTLALDSLRHLCEYLRAYRDSFVDTNIIIYSTDTVTGVLNSKQISYKLKVPLIINNTSYFTAEPKFSLYGGVEAGYSDSKGIRMAPLIGVSLKRQSIFYSYDILNKGHNIGYTRTLYMKFPKPPKIIEK